MSNSRSFTVAINEREYQRICLWTLKQQSLETGGDLFGLWLDKHTAVIQLVLGPGKNCRRTSTSFYQDVPYLDETGSHLTHKEGLCHIGEWHSHHKLRLNHPSGGDENTVWSNMQKYGLTRFVLFIANIIPAGANQIAATVGCFLFEFLPKTSKRLPVLKGRFEWIPTESPFRLKPAVQRKVLGGAETFPALNSEMTSYCDTEDHEEATESEAFLCCPIL